MTTEQRLAELESRLNRVEERLGIGTPIQSQHIPNTPSQVYVSAPTQVQSMQPPAQPQINPANAPVYPNPNRIQSSPRPCPPPVRRNEPVKSDMESFIGKNIFVIIASVLIFIGMIAVAKLILPYLTPEVKFYLMMTFSLAFVIFGLFLINKKKNTLTISLLACGLGVAYITIFTGNLYFKLLNTTALFVLLAAWVVLVCWCFKYETLLFVIIGQSGIIISLLLCVADIILNHNDSIILCAVIFTAVAEVIYDRFGDNRCLDLMKNKIIALIDPISALLSIAILSVPVLDNIEDAARILPVISNPTFDQIISCISAKFIAFLILALVFFVVTKRSIYKVKCNLMLGSKTGQVSYAAVNFAGLFVLGIFTIQIGNIDVSGMDVLAEIIVSIYCLVMFIITECMAKKRKRHLLLTILSSVWISLPIILYYNIVGKLITFNTIPVPGIFLLIPLFMYLVRDDNSCSKVVGYMAAGAATFINVSYGSEHRFITAGLDMVPHEKKIFGISPITSISKVPVISAINVMYFILTVAVIFGCYFVSSRKNEKDRSKASILFWYIFTTINVLGLFIAQSAYRAYEFDKELFSNTSDLMKLLNIVVMVIIQIIFWNACVNKNSKDGRLFEHSSFITYFVLNIIFSLYAIFRLNYMDDSLPMYIIGSFLLITLFTLTSIKIIQKKDDPLAIYVGIKVSILVSVILSCDDDLKPVVSILFFVWAVICIIMGLKLNQKYMRVFALVLALVSAVKLTLIDMYSIWDNNVYRAIGFIICGGLCFLISYIYHKVEQRQKMLNNKVAEKNIQNCP